MAKPSPSQRHPAIPAARKNLKALMLEDGLSYRTLAARAKEPKSGRNINNFLIKDDASPTVDTVAAAATGLKIDLWQLFVPTLSELDRVERRQLKDLVEAFVNGGEATREALMGILKIRADMLKAVQPSEHSSKRG